MRGGEIDEKRRSDCRKGKRTEGKEIEETGGEGEGRELADFRGQQGFGVGEELRKSMGEEWRQGEIREGGESKGIWQCVMNGALDLDDA